MGTYVSIDYRTEIFSVFRCIILRTKAKNMVKNWIIKTLTTFLIEKTLSQEKCLLSGREEAAKKFMYICMYIVYPEKATKFETIFQFYLTLLDIIIV